MNELAIFGGKPIRKKQFPCNAVINECETREIISVINNKEFSRYSGGPGYDIENLLTMKSIDATKSKLPYWNFLGGNKVRKFESDFAKFFNMDYAIAINSATTGLTVSLQALGIGKNDEVITTCMSFTATGTSIVGAGAIPVFVDVEYTNLCISPDAIRKAITKKTKAILVVHLAGNTADMNEIMKIAKEHNLFVIEDCAQSPNVLYKGKLTGTIGDVGVFSFQETKNIMTGEGGMIITNDSVISRKCRLIRNHGETVDDYIIGYNYRMTELTASLGICQLIKLKSNNAVRYKNSKYLINKLSKHNILELPDITNSIPHFLNINYKGDDRDVFLAALNAEGLDIAPGYPRLINKHPVFVNNIVTSKSLECPIAEEIYKKCLWIFEIYPPINRRDLEDIVKIFDKVINQIDKLKGIDNADVTSRR